LFRSIIAGRLRTGRAQSLRYSGRKRTQRVAARLTRIHHRLPTDTLLYLESYEQTGVWSEHESCGQREVRWPRRARGQRHSGTSCSVRPTAGARLGGGLEPDGLDVHRR
jgi:hypothetical protein